MHSLHLPMFGFAALAFLLLCVVLAVAVFFAFKSGEQGRTKLNGFAGCAIGCALLAIAGLGLLVTLIVCSMNAPSEAIRHGPISKFELKFDEVPPPPAPGQPALPEAVGPTRLHASIELRAGADPGPVLAMLRRKLSKGLGITVSTVDREDGQRTLIEIDVAFDEDLRRELAELRTAVREEIPELNLPKGIVVEFRGPDE